MEKDSKKGFTLMELLVTIVVLGIIVGLSIPVIRNIQRAQIEKKYTTYLDSVGYAAKLYTDSYSSDLYGTKRSGCVYVDYTELNRYKLLKDIDIDGISCNSPYTAVKIVRFQNKFYYKPFIGCGVDKNGKANNPDIFRPVKSEVSELCTGDSSAMITIQGVPLADISIDKKEQSPKARLVSETGINKENPTPTIVYGYSYEKNANVINGDWQPASFAISKQSYQKRLIAAGEPQYFGSTMSFPTPAGVTGDLYLVMRVEPGTLIDLEGTPWRDIKTEEDNYVFIGPYRVDNESPKLNDSTVISKAGDSYQSRTPKLNLKVTDEHFTPTSDLKMCYSFDNEPKCPNPTNATSLANSTRYTNYNAKKELREISDEYNGSTHKIYITVADAAGNYVKTDFDYRVASTYKLTFDPNGGGKCDHDSIGQIENKPWGERVVNEKGLNVNTFCKTTKKGHSIVGWFKKADGTGGEVKETDIATADLKVYAKWKVNTYKLSYNSNGGTACSPKDVKYNEAYGTLCTPTKKGHTLLGWYTAASGGTKVDATTKMGDANTTIYAHWKVNKYKVNYNTQGGAACNPTYKEVTYDTKYGTLCETTRSGYNFAGWYTAASGGNKVTENNVISDSDVTIYARWAAKNYTLTYNSNGGSTCSPKSKTVTYNQPYGTLCNPTRNGYTFGGWYTAASGGTKVDANTKMGVGNTTIYAHWNANPVYITFNGNGNTGGSTPKQTCYYDQICTIAANGFSKTGHAWTGWYTSASGGTKLGNTIKLTGNLTVYAQWELAKYRINYNGNGSTSGSTAYTECVYNSNCQLRANGFAKVGHDWEGWYNKATGGTKYGAYTQIKDNITAYANWKPKPYQITYNGNGNTGGSTGPSTCDYNVPCNFATNGFSKTGYSWSGWYTAIAGGTKYGSSIRITGPLTVYAQWNVNSYTLTYNVNGGNACSPATKKVNYGAAYGTLCVPTRNGYTFGGWYTAASGGTQVTASTTMKAANTTIYAHWNPNPVTVTFKPNGGSGTMANQTCYYNQNCTLNANTFTKTGHGWTGWFASASGGTAMTSPVKLTGNLTVYAQWKPNVYSISYDPNGGSGTMAATTCNYGATCTLSANKFTRTGYTWDGWYTTSSGGTKYGSTTTLSGSIRVYAHWKANPVTLSYNGNGNTGGSTPATTCYYNQACTTATNGFTKTGHTWDGWYDKTSGGTKYTTITLTGNKTLYAQWKANPITISYNANGGTGSMASHTCDYGKSCSLKTNTFSRTGYSFGGWYTAATGGSAMNSTFTATGNITVYAHWNPNSYVIIYNPNGGSACASKTVKFNEAYGTLCTPTRTGFTFAGWYTAASGGSQVTASTKMTTTGATIYAHWTTNSYTLTYNNNGGSGCSTKSVAYGAAYGTLCTPSRTGYNFAGWFTAASGGSQVSASTTMSSTGATIYAHWTNKTINVTFNCNGGSGGGSQSFTYGVANQKFSKTCSRTGYTLSGWKLTAGGASANYSVASGVGNDWINTYAPSVTVYAHWTANTYTVSYAGGGATGGSTAATTCTYGTTFSPRANGFTRSHYHFNGWSGSTTCTGNMTMTATWAPNVAIIRYHTGTGSGSILKYKPNANWAIKNSYQIWNGNTQDIHTIAYGSSGDPMNYNNKGWIYIWKKSSSSGTAVSGKEWKLCNGATCARSTYNQSTTYSSEQYCDTTNGNCVCCIKVNWK